MEGEAAKRSDSVIRIVASAALILYLCLAWGSGLDRLSIASPALERFVPGPLRAQADRSAAAVALARGDSASALLFASRAVRNDPLDPLSDSLLGSAWQYRGDPRKAEAAFRVAATRGWRDRLTQLYWYGAALESGDAERAALRADALMRADPYFASAGLFAPLEASPAGRAALARRLAGNPGWASAYLAVDAKTDATQLKLKSEIVALATRQGGALDCKAPKPLVVIMVERGLRRDAERLWRAACGGSALGKAENGLIDGGFEQLAAGSEDSPFGWRTYASGDVLAEPVAQSAGGHALSLRNSASVSRLALSQALALAPGEYRVRAKVSQGGGASQASMVISLDCGAGSRRPSIVRGDVADAGQLLSVGACDSQVLGVWLRPGASEVTIDDLAIERLR